MKKIEKILVPIAIILASIVGSIGYYSVQVQKQNSIEKQLMMKLEQEQAKEKARLVFEKETNLEKIELEREKESRMREKEAFSNELRCQTLFKDLRQRYNNIVGISYSDWQNTCSVKYKQDGEVKEAPIETMQDI